MRWVIELHDPPHPAGTQGEAQDGNVDFAAIFLFRDSAKH
jgi:hypothetical protein